MKANFDNLEDVQASLKTIKAAWAEAPEGENTDLDYIIAVGIATVIIEWLEAREKRLLAEQGGEHG